MSPLRCFRGSRPLRLLDIEELGEGELQDERQSYERLAERARQGDGETIDCRS